MGRYLRSRYVIDMTFKFDNEKHAYTLEGKPLIGTTTLIKEILPPPLVWWGAGMALKNLGWTNPKQVPKEKGIEEAESSLRELKQLGPIEFYDLLQKCYRYHNEFKKERGERGTNIHELVEEAVKDAIKNNNGYLQEEYEDEKLREFAKWGKDKRFLASEVQVYSEKIWVAGTVDLVYEEDGRYYLGDIKTSKSFYPSQFIQMGLYDYQQAENGFYSNGKKIGEPKKIHGYAVINLNDKVEAKTYFATEDMRKFAENLAELYKRKQKLEEFVKGQ
jgi:hypothetical protein